MANRTFADDHPIPGEIWRNTPCGLAHVSDQGRCRNIFGHLVKAFPVHQGERPRWHIRAKSPKLSYDPPVLVAHVFLGGTLGPHSQIGFRNGDPSDWRAANLTIAWTEAQDAMIRSSVSRREASRMTGRGRAAVSTRARTLGKTWPRTISPGVRLADRLPDALAAVEELERAGVGDARINQALRIDERKRFVWGASIDPNGQRVCLGVLARAGWSPARIASAFGWTTGAATARMKLRQFGFMEPTGWDGTKAGRPDEIDGEEWRQHSSGNWVSNLGRVAGPRGLLTICRGAGHHPRVCIATPSGPSRHTTITVAKMMLEVFRPGLDYDKKLLANGDVNDVRLGNIRVPIDEQAARSDIRKLIPSNWEPADREVVAQAAVLAMMEGRALDVKEAVRLGKAEQRGLKDQRARGGERIISLDDQTNGGTSFHELIGTPET